LYAVWVLQVDLEYDQLTAIVHNESFIMEKFIVSARKYRPQNFSTVVGQSHITTTLKNAINNNQLAHAFLFCGPRGVGKTTCARILAKTINCENKSTDGEACNICNSCTSFDAGTSLNIHELDAASNNSVDDIRALVDQVRFAPQAGQYKVYIVDEVHMLSASAFNAFLKTLEEPPPFAIFILATTEKHKILPTILSRCQIFDFKRITTNDTVDHLMDICKKEQIDAERTALHIIAQKSEGCMRDSLSILDKIVSFTDGHLTYINTLEHLNILDEDYYFQLLEQLQQQQLSDALLLLDSILQKGFEPDSFLEGFAEFIRNLLVSKDSRAIALLEVATDFKEKYQSWALKTDMGWILSTLNILTEAATNYKTTRNKRLFTEMVLIKLSYLQQALQLETNGEGLNKKKGTEHVKAVSFRSIGIKADKTSEKKIQHIPATEAIMLVEQPAPRTNSSTIAPSKIGSESTAAIPHISQPNEQINESANSGKPLLSSLKSLREQMAKQHLAGNKEQIIPLGEENLQAAWNAYIELLKANKNHSSVSIFKMVSLEIRDHQFFYINVGNGMQQKFIEVERSNLIEFLMKYFNNRQIGYQIVVKETAQDLNEDLAPQLSKKEKYQLLIAQYPNIKILRDRIRLELE
jgi:DNA polymerase-3 subunit gamma/tau